MPPDPIKRVFAWPLCFLTHRQRRHSSLLAAKARADAATLRCTGGERVIVQQVGRFGAFKEVENILIRVG